MPAFMDVVIAAESERRFVELCKAVADVPVRLVTPFEALGGDPPAIEDAEGFEATAERRARELCRRTGLLTVAEVSGLCVDALGGRPGLRSACFAGDRATDAENNAALLAALEELDDDERTARFRCVLAMKAPWAEEIELIEGSLEGRIARTARGSGGFGYEPLFVVGEDGATVMAELDERGRLELSPNARAARALLSRLLDTLDGLLDDTSRIVG